jgi:hypothetical protein
VPVTKEEEIEKLWSAEDFDYQIYALIPMYDKEIDSKEREYKRELQLFISMPELKGDTYHLLKKKFGFDGDANSKIYRHHDFDISFRIITPEMDIGAKWVSNVGAILFVLPPGEFESTEEDR